MQLVAEGRLRLDDRLSKLLPGRFRPGAGSACGTCSTTRAGSRTTWATDLWSARVARNPQAVIPPRRLVSSVARLPLEFRPGSRASYSNTNYLVLGGDPPASDRPIGGAPAARADLRAARPHGDEVRAGYADPARRRAPRLRRRRAHRRSTSRGARARRALGRRRASSRTRRDLATFFVALLQGRLVPPHLVAEMEKIVRARTARGSGCTGSRPRAVAGSTGTPAARPATSRSPRAHGRERVLRRRLERRQHGGDPGDGRLPRRAHLPVSRRPDSNRGPLEREESSSDRKKARPAVVYQSPATTKEGSHTCRHSSRERWPAESLFVEWRSPRLRSSRCWWPPAPAWPRR